MTDTNPYTFDETQPLSYEQLKAGERRHFQTHKHAFAKYHFEIPDNCMFCRLPRENPVHYFPPPPERPINARPELR